MLSSNACVGPSPRIEIFLFLLSIFTVELILDPKIMTFFPMLPAVDEKPEQESNPML